MVYGPWNMYCRCGSAARRLHKGVVEAILDVNPEHLYYVSCNPETLARDLRLLVSKYTIEKVQPMDFFPHTDHVETAVKLWNPRTSNH
jgi:23S rRNA (uracil1939-C5)-methyltransferase